MLRRVLIVLFAVLALAAVPGLAQSPDSQNTPPENEAPPRSDSGMSSSKDTRIDLSPPAGDATMHPSSDVDDIMEMHPYNPHKAEKNVEVGDYYFKQKNYRAAQSRYAEALLYKPNDAEATYKLGVSQEKLGETDDALASYQAYLKILPEGPRAEDSKRALDRLTNPAAEKKENRKEKKKKGS
jgi:tetratricopeptide (TPR) repeat protein